MRCGKGNGRMELKTDRARRHRRGGGASFLRFDVRPRRRDRQSNQSD